MKTFKTALTNVVAELSPCATIDWNDCNEMNATVHFLEEDGSNKVHGLMHELYARLSNEVDYPVNICHNDPTDGNIQILGAKDESTLWDPKECCKAGHLWACKRFLASDRTCYMESSQSIYLAAECVAECLGTTPELILEVLDWDRDPQAQLIQLLIGYHN